MKRAFVVFLLSCVSSQHIDIVKKFDFEIDYSNPNEYEKQYILTRHYLRSNEYSKSDNSELATKEIETALKHLPESPILEQKYIIELSKSGDFPKALELIQGIDKKSDELKNVEAWLYMAVGELDKSKQIYRELTYKNVKKNQESCLLLSKLLIIEKNFGDATKTLDFCFSKTRNYDFLYEKASILLLNNNPVEAKSTLENIIQASPSNAKALLALASISGPEKGLELYKTFLEQNSGNLAILDKSIQLALELKNYDLAIQYLQRALELDSSNYNYGLQLAILYQVQEYYDLAIPLFKELLTLFPESAKINFYLADIYFRKKDFRKTREYLEKIPASSAMYTVGINLALQSFIMENNLKKLNTFVQNIIQKNPSIKPDIYYNLSLLYLDAGLNHEAIALLKQIDLDIDGRYTLALLHNRLGDREISINILEEIIKEKQDHAHALNFLGYIYLEKDLSRAFELLGRAIELSPQDPYIMDSLGKYYFKIGKFEDAISYTTKAWDQVKELEMAKNLAEIYLHLGNETKLKELYQEVLQKIPDSPEKKNLLDYISVSQRKVASP